MRDALRVLIVEDEAAILLQLEATLEDEGYELVGTAMSSREAIDRLALTKPDLVLLDLNLIDGPTGCDVARRARDAGVDFIFMTANANVATGIGGAMGILAKPFSRNAIVATLRFVAECIQAPPPKQPHPPEFMITAELANRVGLAASSD